MTMEAHVNEREKFYASMREDFWPELYDIEYSLLDIELLDKDEVKEVHLGTKRIGQVYKKFATLLREAPDSVLLALDLPQSALSFVRLNVIDIDTVIARFDWVKTPNGYKMLEINADTPTFIKELFHVNGSVCNYFGVKNPNEGMTSQLKTAMQTAIKRAANYVEGIEGEPHVAFTSHHDHQEDYLTTLYLQEVAGVKSAKYVCLDDLRIDENGLYNQDENRIHILYRQTYPIEHLVLDTDENNGNEVGKMLLKLVEERKLAIINPPSAFLLQSKALQAAIWGLHESNQFFTEEERGWIEKYMLPTYLDPDKFLERGGKYVKKPSFGREGDTIEILEGEQVVMAEKERTYESSLPVYQDFVALPTRKVNTINGVEEIHMLVGCFIVDGEPSALGIRAGGQITGNTSYFLPVGLKNN